MSVIELKQEALSFSEQVLEEKLLIPNMLDDPRKVQLLLKALFGILLHFLCMQVIFVKAEE